jgi:DNA-directed RNA polymerase subunit RPC12/RpoP
MPDMVKELTCSRCGHTWYQDFTGIDKQQLIFKGETTQRTYSVACPNCGTRKTLVVRIMEDDEE